MTIDWLSALICIHISLSDLTHLAGTQIEPWHVKMLCPGKLFSRALFTHISLPNWLIVRDWYSLKKKPAEDHVIGWDSNNSCGCGLSTCPHMPNMSPTSQLGHSFVESETAITAQMPQPVKYKVDKVALWSQLFQLCSPSPSVKHVNHGHVTRSWPYGRRQMYSNSGVTLKLTSNQYFYKNSQSIDCCM